MTGIMEGVDPGYLALGDLESPLDFEKLFGRTAPVELEIGAGRGDFMVRYAAANPHLNLVAVERKLTVLRKAATKAGRAQVPHVRIINSDIRHLLAEYFPPGALHAVHIYFPDPWPKKCHEKRRLLTDPAFVTMAADRLQPGGHLHFRTDHAAYFAAALGVLRNCPALAQVEVPPELATVTTTFEDRFTAAGVSINRASFVRLAK